MMNERVTLRRRRAAVLCIMGLIAAAHILPPESYLQGELRNLYYSYFSDVVLPFGSYFLLGLSGVQIPLLRRWPVKLALAFLIPAIAETCQYFGIPALGETFDPLDYLMYGIGATTAAVIDRQVLARICDFWDSEKLER